MADYRYLLDCSVIEEFVGLPSHSRRFLLVIFRQIAEDPFRTGDTTFRDSSDREIQKRQFGTWIVSFWAGHAVKEVRIVGIQKMRR